MTPAIYWLTQNLTDVPVNDDWLTAGERARLEKLRIPKRRADWRLGRWTAKRALAAYFQQEMTDECAAFHQHSNLREAPGLFCCIEIRAAVDGAPEVFAHDRPVPANISISHRDELGLCAVIAFPFALGCDVEKVEARSSNFVEDFFNDEERSLVAQASPHERCLYATLIWSAKESTLKALRQGLRRDTRSVKVMPLQADNLSSRWNPLTVHCRETQCTFHGWWLREGRYVFTTLADHSIVQPRELQMQPPPGAFALQLKNQTWSIS